MIFVGDDWAETHHDIVVLDERGARLARRRVPEGLVGIGELHALLAEHAEDPSDVVVGIETDRGLWVSALVEAGYEVFAINPFASSRYRDRHTTSGAKSDPGDAQVLADLLEDLALPRTRSFLLRQLGARNAPREGPEHVAQRVMGEARQVLGEPGLVLSGQRHGGAPP